MRLGGVVLGLAMALIATFSVAQEGLPGSLQYVWVITQADGSAFRVTFFEDGTYETDSGIKGTWKLEGTQLCVQRSTGEANCMEAHPDAKPGDSFQSQDAAGNPVTVTIE